MSQEELTPYDEAARGVVDLANRLAEEDGEADPWEIADGMMAGAVHYWLYTRQPCGDPRCESCAPISTAEERLTELLRMVEGYARANDYFHAPHDRNVGRA